MRRPKRTPVDADEFGIWDSVSLALRKVTWANIKTLLLWATITNAATAKTTPIDADLFSIVDTAASNVIKKLTWANLKATFAAGVGHMPAGAVVDRATAFYTTTPRSRRHTRRRHHPDFVRGNSDFLCVDHAEVDNQ